MEAVYITGLLGTLGYLMSKENENTETQAKKLKISENEKPSVNNLYETEHYNTTMKKVIKENNKVYNKSVDNKNKKGNVVPINKKHVDTDKHVYSRLADVDLGEFKHNNMVPFFGGKITQNMDLNYDDGKLERFTGRDRYWKPKQETENFASDLKKNSQNVFGKEVTLDFEKSRYVNERFVNNVLPFEQVKVGPGLDDGYTSKPSGGLQQANKREFELPKSVDELRYKTNPKVTYEGRVVDGQKASLPGEIGEVCKNRVDTVYEQTPDMYLKTGDTANSTKETQRPCVDLKETNRSTTTTKGYDSNVQSVVKSITAPLLDTMKLSKKQYTTMHARPQGNFQNTNPSKLTIYDPNDVARTTIKETTIHDTRTGTLTGATKTIVYNPDDVARPTLRQATEKDSRLGHVGYQNADAYKTVKVEAPVTDRALTSDNEYYGVGDSKDEKQMSYDDKYNATINEVRDILFKNRKPTKTGVKVYNEIDNMNVNHKKLESDNVIQRDNMNYGRITNEIPTTNVMNITQDRNQYKNDYRFNPEIMAPLKNNPYNRPLNVF
tara:strand:+ start:156 stop:1808 length:1653 start_codon:yes stop_codon:yes gene_type:complete